MSMVLTQEQVAEVQTAKGLWKSYLSDLQANVILTPQRKEALATLVALAEAVLTEGVEAPRQEAIASSDR